MAYWVLSVASAVLMTGLGIFLWVRRPPAPLWPVAFVCQVFALLWVFGDMWAVAATGSIEKQLGLLMLYTGAIGLPAAWWTTARVYIRSHGLRRGWLESHWASLPVAGAVLAWLFVATNPWHHAFVTPVIGAPNVYHWPGKLLVPFNWAVTLATAALCWWAARSHPAIAVRRKMAILAVASVCPLVANLFHFALPKATRLDVTVVGIGVTSALIIYGIYRSRLFNPLPVALPEIIAADPDGLLLLDRGGKLLFWNPSAEELLSGLPLELDLDLPAALAPRLESPAAERIEGGTELTWLLTGKDDGARTFRLLGAGEERWLALSLIPVSRRQRLVAVCLRVEDVTARVCAERERANLAEQMRRMEKLKSLGLMAGGVAHDFNNLLTAIGGSAYLALDEARDGLPVERHLEEIAEAADLAGGLTDQLLSYAGRGGVSREPVSLAELARDTLRVIESSLPNRTTLDTHLAGDVVVEGDPVQLRQVLINLVTNAAEAIGSALGYVTVRTARVDLDAARLRREELQGRLDPGEYALLEVSDSGCGMDAHTRGLIFDPFFSTKLRGRGLGLAAVFGIVRAHGGAISVESEPGRGSAVRVWLPAGHGPVPVRPHETEPREAGAAAGTILLVDDDERVRRVARAVLERGGFDVVGASSGAEAVEIFPSRHDEIRAVVLDLTMPDMGGAEALREIQAIDPEVRVVLSSGFAESDVTRSLRDAKLRGFLHKPYRPPQLLAAVRRALED